MPLVTMATREFWAVCALSAVAALFPRYDGMFSDVILVRRELSGE